MSLSQSCFSSRDELSVIPYQRENGGGYHHVHRRPLTSSFLMSAKSLEMCTESLGSESGIDECHIITEERERRQSCVKAVVKNKKKKVCFPPPLSSMNGVGVRSHREGGRLVMEAFTDPSARRCCFVAERGEGRLRLRLQRHDQIYVKEDEAAGCGKVGCVFGGIRCNGGTTKTQLQSLPFCVAGIS